MTTPSSFLLLPKDAVYFFEFLPFLFSPSLTMILSLSSSVAFPPSLRLSWHHWWSTSSSCLGSEREGNQHQSRKEKWWWRRNKPRSTKSREGKKRSHNSSRSLYILLAPEDPSWSFCFSSWLPVSVFFLEEVDPFGSFETRSGGGREEWMREKRDHKRGRKRIPCNQICTSFLPASSFVFLGKIPLSETNVSQQNQADEEGSGIIFLVLCYLLNFSLSSYVSCRLSFFLPTPWSLIFSCLLHFNHKGRDRNKNRETSSSHLMLFANWMFQKFYSIFREKRCAKCMSSLH